MTQKNNILQELRELKSSLPFNHQQPYMVPSGYFDGLVTAVLNRIKTQEATGAREELSSLSPLLNHASRQMPYSVPAGYFERLAENIGAVAQGNSNDLAAKEELETISPLLSGLKKQMPYTVPAGYFQTLSGKPGKEEYRSATKIISITSRKWFRYAVAAVVAGVIATAGFLLLQDNAQQIHSGSRVVAKVSRDIKKMNETQKDDLIDFIDAGMTGDETARLNPPPVSNEVKELLQDVSDQELKDFQEQTEDVQDVLMTN